ncbi:MAG: WYL domain-containing protein, partial [Actinobacteria bacterium]|nr:WYL domain-containing protein [Actinomycetota bacterium]
FTRPADFNVESSVPTDPKSFGNGASEHATVRVDANLASGVIAELGRDAVIRENADTGQIDVKVACGNFDAFRVWLFAMVDRAEVVEPASVRERIVAELVALGGAK